MRRVFGIAAILAICGLVAVGYWVIRGTGGAAAPPGIPVGAVAPQASLVGLKETITPGRFHGRNLVLAFITPSCPTCAADLRRVGSLVPNLIPAHGLRTYFVVVDRSPLGAGRISRFASSVGVTSGPYLTTDPTGRAWHLYGVTTPGTIFVISADGRVAWRSLDPPVSLLRAEVNRVAPLANLACAPPCASTA